MANLIFSPVGQIYRETHELARRPDSLAGLRIGVLDNSKANARKILTLIAESLVSQDGATLAQIVRKKTASRPCDPNDMAGLLKGADVVLTGTADCGSCTTWSVHDVATIEAAGVPTILVTTTSFQDLAATVGETLGYATIPLAVTEHPIGGATDNQIAEKATGLVKTARRLLVRGTAK